MIEYYTTGFTQLCLGIVAISANGSDRVKGTNSAGVGTRLNCWHLGHTFVVLSRW